jgi:hypothetical protein
MMTTRTRVAALAAGLALAVTSLSGCQWLAGQATPSFPPATATPNPSPPETAQEREMREDQEAAMKAYTTASKEFDRLLMAGGATKPSKILLATTGGEYLETQMYVLETFKERGWRADRPIKTSVVADGGWSPDNLGLTACEDDSQSKIFNKKGKEVFKDRDRRYVQTLTATKKNGVWRITKGESKAVKTFEHEGNCAP